MGNLETMAHLTTQLYGDCDCGDHWGQPHHYKECTKCGGALPTFAAGEAACDALGAAIKTLAERHRMPHSPNTVTDTLRSHSNFYANPASFVQLRIARKAPDQHQLNYRAELFSPLAACMLRDALGEEQGATRNYLRSVLSTLNTCCTAVDGDPALGLVKLWQSGCYTVDQLAAVPGAPCALKAYLPFFKKHQFSRVFFTGCDLTKSTMNVYFSLHESHRKSEDHIIEIF